MKPLAPVVLIAFVVVNIDASGALPPPIENHLIQLQTQGLNVGIGKVAAQRAHAIRVRARAADGVVK